MQRCATLQVVLLGQLAHWSHTPSRRFGVTWQVVQTLACAHTLLLAHAGLHSRHVSILINDGRVVFLQWADRATGSAWRRSSRSMAAWVCTRGLLLAW